MLKELGPKKPTIKIETNAPVAKAQSGAVIQDALPDPLTIFEDKYNTELNTSEKAEFFRWMKSKEIDGTVDSLNKKGHFDIQGWWKDLYKNETNENYIEKFRKPNDPKFSELSMYHGVDGYFGGEFLETQPHQDETALGNEESGFEDDDVRKYQAGGAAGSGSPKLDYDTTEAEATHQEGKDFVTRWMAHPETRKRYRANMNELQNTNETNLGVDNEKFRNALVGVQQARPKFMKYFNDGEHALYKGDRVTYYGQPTIGTTTHEHVHATKGIDKDLTNYAMNKWGLTRALRDQFPGLSTTEAIKKKFGLSSDMRAADYLKHANYMSQNGELYPRFMEMRQFLNVTPGQEITNDMIQQIYANPKTKQAADYYTPEQLKEILNTIAVNTPKSPYKYQNSQNYGYAADGGRIKPPQPEIGEEDLI